MTTSDADFLARWQQVGRFFMGTADVQVALVRVVRRFDELEIPYAVCGGLAVNAHGYARTTTDVDLLVTAEGLLRFKAASLGLGWLDRFAGSRGVRDTERRVPIDFLIAGGIPGDGTPHGVTFPDPVGVTIEKAGTHYLALAKLIELKLASGVSLLHRLQDLADVAKLIEVNALGEHFGDRLHPWVRSKFAELWRNAQVRDPHAE